MPQVATPCPSPAIWLWALLLEGHGGCGWASRGPEEAGPSLTGGLLRVGWGIGCSCLWPEEHFPGPLKSSSHPSAHQVLWENHLFFWSYVPYFLKVSFSLVWFWVQREVGLDAGHWAKPVFAFLLPWGPETGRHWNGQAAPPMLSSSPGLAWAGQVGTGLFVCVCVRSL